MQELRWAPQTRALHRGARGPGRSLGAPIFFLAQGPPSNSGVGCRPTAVGYGQPPSGGGQPPSAAFPVPFQLGPRWNPSRARRRAFVCRGARDTRVRAPAPSAGSTESVSDPCHARDTTHRRTATGSTLVLAPRVLGTAPRALGVAPGMVGVALSVEVRVHASRGGTGALLYYCI